MASVAVTGHRHSVVTPALLDAIDTAIVRLDQSLGGPLTMVSQLAEGADRLIVHRAIALGHQRLIAVLPMAEGDYVATFAAASAIDDFRDLLTRADEVLLAPAAATPELSYRTAGRIMLDRADALIAIWDGAPARGPGGTGEVVEDARARGMSIELISSN